MKSKSALLSVLPASLPLVTRVLSASAMAPSPCRSRDLQLPLRLIGHHREVGKGCGEIEIGLAGGEIAIGRDVDIVVAEMEAFGLEPFLGARHASIETDRSGQNLVEGWLRQFEIVGRTIETEIEAADQRADRPGGGEFHRTIEVAPRQAGERRNRTCFQRDIAVEDIVVDGAGERQLQRLADEAQLRQLHRLAGIPQPGDAEADAVAQSRLNLWIARRDAGNRRVRS